MSTFVPASRVSKIRVSPSTAAAARARELKAAGRDIADLTVGEPDFDTPEAVKAAAHAAIDRGETKYTAVNGTPALRKAIIGDFQKRLGITYGDSEICVGGGAKQILFPGADGKCGKWCGSHHSGSLLGVLSRYGHRQ